VVAKVEWHPGELYPRVGFIVTNLARPAERLVAFYNQRGTAEQYIKEGKGAIRWTRLSCRTFAANAVRLQLHALAYNLGNFMRTLAMPKRAPLWSLTSLREKLIKIGAKVVSHGRYVTFQAYIHPASYGYRRGRSALDAVGAAHGQCGSR
jgi:Transposase DDE domain group 1